MKTRLEQLIEQWRANGVSEAVIAICLASPMIASLKDCPAVTEN